MTNSNSGKRRYLMGVMSLLGSLAMASLTWGQSVPQLEVEVSAIGQVKILARDVSYGRVLRILQEKLGVAIEIPARADELTLDYARIEASQPDEALKKLLDGSGLGYAWLAPSHRVEKVVVLAGLSQQASEIIPSTSAPNTRHSPVQDHPAEALDIASFAVPAKQGSVEDPTSLPVPAAQVWPLSEAGMVNGKESSLATQGTSTMPLSEAINAIGVPPGVSPADVGTTKTFSMSEAGSVIGVPPGMSFGDVGKTTTMPLPTGPGKHP